MDTLRRWLVKIAAGERGQGMVEYALIITVISIPIVLIGIGLVPAFETWAQGVAAAILGAGG